MSRVAPKPELAKGPSSALRAAVVVMVVVVMVRCPRAMEPGHGSRVLLWQCQGGKQSLSEPSWCFIDQNHAFDKAS